MNSMTETEYDLAVSLLWDAKIGPEITTNTELSELLADDLKSKGIIVTRVGRKPRSRSKWILFDIEVFKIKGLEMMFLSEEEARAWHLAKNRSFKTLVKAPKDAFKDVQLEKAIETIWWTGAFNLAWRIGAINKCKEGVLKKRGSFYGAKMGL